MTCPTSSRVALTRESKYHARVHCWRFVPTQGSRLSLSRSSSRGSRNMREPAVCAVVGQLSCTQGSLRICSCANLSVLHEIARVLYKCTRRTMLHCDVFGLLSLLNRDPQDIGQGDEYRQQPLSLGFLFEESPLCLAGHNVPFPNAWIPVFGASGPHSRIQYHLPTQESALHSHSGARIWRRCWPPDFTHCPKNACAWLSDRWFCMVAPPRRHTAASTFALECLT